jgi:putative protein-disulfide isomerase
MTDETGETGGPGETDEAADRLIYFADPMCSWCWGFAPVMAALRAQHGARLPVRLVLGGLRVGTTEPLDDAGKGQIRAHWQHVTELAGQPFDFDFFARDGFVYDTEPACRAVVAARRLAPDRAVDFLTHLHRAFYARNRDVTDRDTLLSLAEDFGFDRRSFATAFDSEETREETLDDFRITRNAGIGGYPALIAGNRDDGYSFITLGYQAWDRIQGVLESWLETRAPIEAGSDAR